MDVNIDVPIVGVEALRSASCWISAERGVSIYMAELLDKIVDGHLPWLRSQHLALLQCFCCDSRVTRRREFQIQGSLSRAGHQEVWDRASSGSAKACGPTALGHASMLAIPSAHVLILPGPNTTLVVRIGRYEKCMDLRTSRGVRTFASYGRRD
jgi:hypothetical protein